MRENSRKQAATNNHILFQQRTNTERCQCGRFMRNRRFNATMIVAGKQYDTVVPLNNGMDAKVRLEKDR